MLQEKVQLIKHEAFFNKDQLRCAGSVMVVGTENRIVDQSSNSNSVALVFTEKA